MSEPSSLRHRTTRQREIDRKTHTALAKRELGEDLTDYEWMIVQYALGGACSACGGRSSSQTEKS
ncbi:MAG: hypothetical protein H0U65_01325 [Rubrobacter sp.]|nr:hypothetical protein [Rubrobacter sp.]